MRWRWRDSSGQAPEQVKWSSGAAVGRASPCPPVPIPEEPQEGQSQAPTPSRLRREHPPRGSSPSPQSPLCPCRRTRASSAARRRRAAQRGRCAALPRPALPLQRRLGAYMVLVVVMEYNTWEKQSKSYDILKNGRDFLYRICQMDNMNE